MKAKLTAEEFKQSTMKDHYKLQADGSYLLNVEGGFLDLEDPAKLKSALIAERAEKDKSALELKLLKEKLEGVDDEAAAKAAADAAEAKLKLEQEMVKNKDFQGILDQQKADREADKAEFQRQLQERDDAQAKAAQDAQTAIIAANANSICREIFGEGAEKLAAIVSPRLTVGAGNQLGALDSDGNPMSLQDFKAELVADPVFAPMINVSKGSGAGSTQSPDSPVDVEGKSFNELSADQRTQLYRQDPEKFNSLKSTAGPAPEGTAGL